MLNETTDLLAQLIAFPTISTDSNLAMIAFLADHLETAGARVEVHLNETGDKANLFATIGPDTDGGIILSGHSDVVPVADQDWTSDPFEMARRDGNLYGRGTCDMKGFIAAAVTLAPRFAETIRDRPIHFAFTHDEETGCIGAGHLVARLRESGLRPAMAIIGEPTSMQIIEGHKGCYEYSTHFHGLEGHGSSPDLGVNAVEYAARYINRLLELREDLHQRTPKASRFVPPWTTINVGALHGGVAHNVIASKAQVDWEMRPVQAADAAYVKDRLKAYCEHTLLPAMRAIHPEAEILTEVMGEVDGLEPTDDNEARRIVAELTGANNADLVPFGTEAGLFQALGMDVVVCGPGSIDQAHKADEYLSLDQLGKCLDMLNRLADRMAA
ncbi:MAG: acetylornithine deacetylase [Rhodobacteraceae bacterium]|nr:acetylornithine deacetylase [Paracoccaceae bacterium]MCB1366983.1 acetylornithine deacetylase [Paracoccaceae bacterium]